MVNVTYVANDPVDSVLPPKSSVAYASLITIFVTSQV